VPVNSFLRGGVKRNRIQKVPMSDPAASQIAAPLKVRRKRKDTFSTDEDEKLRTGWRVELANGRESAPWSVGSAVSRAMEVVAGSGR
jgi:hypothetical protein